MQQAESFTTMANLMIARGEKLTVARQKMLEVFIQKAAITYEQYWLKWMQLEITLSSLRAALEKVHALHAG